MTLPELIERYGYLAVLLGTCLEGETILVMAGFAAHQGHLALTGVLSVLLVPTELPRPRQMPHGFHRIPVVGGTAETVATRTRGANGIVVDGSYVYWIANDRVLRTALQ